MIKKRRVFLLALAVAGLPAIAAAQNVKIITAADLAQHSYRSVVEALENEPGITIERTGYMGGNQWIYINGDKRVLLLLDGRRLNVDMGVGRGSTGIDAGTLPAPDIVDHIEIIKGASAARYGNGSAGGVINIITKRATDNSVWVETGIGSMKGYEYNGALSAKKKSYGFLLYGGTNHLKDIDYTTVKSGDSHTMEPSKWEEDTFGFKLDKEWGKEKLLTFNYQHTFKDGFQYGSIEPLAGYDTNFQRTQLNNNATLRYDWNQGRANNGFAALYHNYYKGRDNWFGTIYQYDETKNGIDLEQNFRLNAKNTLLAGFTHHNTTLKSWYYGNSEDSKDLKNTAVYLDDKWQLGKEWLINAGLRYDHFSSFGSKLLPSVALHKDFGSKANAYATWSKIFNAPTGNQLYYNYKDFTGYRILGNEDLNAEYGDNYTIGYTAQPTENTSWGISFFKSRLNDAIVWTDTGSGVLKAFNNSTEDRKGLELSLQHKFSPKWQGYASYSYVKVDDAYDADMPGTILPLLPNQYRLGATYTLAKWNLDLTARLASGGSKNNYVDSSYYTFDLASKYVFSKDWQMFAKIYNLLDKAYVEKGGLTSTGEAAYPMPGRCFFTGLQYTF